MFVKCRFRMITYAVPIKLILWRPCFPAGFVSFVRHLQPCHHHRESSRDPMDPWVRSGHRSRICWPFGWHGLLCCAFLTWAWLHVRDYYMFVIHWSFLSQLVVCDETTFILYDCSELSTGRMDPQVGSGRVTFLPDFSGTGRVSTSDFKFFTDYFLVPDWFSTIFNIL